MTFTKDELAGALRELGELAVGANKVIDLAVYGFCLILVSNFRVFSDDVDAVAMADQESIDRFARIVAERRDWPADWLNDGVRTYLSPTVEGHEAHELFATYPNETAPGLRVYVPTVEYMLAMKLMALRIEPGGKDLDDILNLMQITKLEDKKELVGFASQFYPEARVSGKLLLALDHIWRAHQAHIVRQDREPPRYLGRSGPTIKG